MKLQTNIYALNCVVLLSSIFRSSGAMSEVFIFNLQSVNVCDIVNCGKGTCQETTSSLFGFDCDCNSGWTKFQLGSLTFPPCVVPNCTLSSDCGTGSPSPPTLPQPEFNLTDAILGAVMEGVKRMGIATNVIAVQTPITFSMPQPYLASKNVL
ncbi:hypothetical protein V6N13_095238 [Hibiscus sabdariffa]